jgi:outer membrane protein OmpA-like peptidoglycan-associated protein
MAEDARIITIERCEESLNERRKPAPSARITRGSGTAAARSPKPSGSTGTERREPRRRSSARGDETDAQRIAQSDIERAGRDKADAESARAAAVLAQQAAQVETDKARLATGEADRLRLKAEGDKADLRAQLLRQFSLVLETRDTARGLIVNMSDVLFDSGKYSLRPGAREKLAKVAGIISGHPGLKLEVEGHTDNVGGDEFNQKLSEQRGTAVRDYLTHQGIAANSVTTEGFGKSKPVVSNDTAAGRQQNRRVELVVSGEIIGGHIGPLASR